MFKMSLFCCLLFIIYYLLLIYYLIWSTYKLIYKGIKDLIFHWKVTFLRSVIKIDILQIALGLFMDAVIIFTWFI